MMLHPNLRLVHDDQREVPMDPCPSEEVLILYASLSPGAPPEEDELLDGWTARTIEEHVGRCEACERVVRQSGELLGALQMDELEEPPAAFWDEMAAGVMRSIDEPAAEETETHERSNLVTLPAAPTDPMPSTGTSGRRMGRWAWAAAAALAMALAVWSLYPGAEDAGQDAVASKGVDGLIPDAEQANQLAVELGLSLDGFNSLDVTPEVELLDVGDAFGDAALSTLSELLEDDHLDDLELALADGDPIGQLLELDTDELALVLEALES